MLVQGAIIGGTGLGELLRALPGRAFSAPTSFGPLRGRILDSGVRAIAAVSRHSAGHKVAPHAVNYRAIAEGLRMLGVRYCLASAAVGSLREDWSPGTLAQCTGMLDFSFRGITMHDREVRHTDFSEPFDAKLRNALSRAAEEAGLRLENRAVYVNANGPRYETSAEIRFYRGAGGDVVGMTAGTEAIVMREAGLSYACVAVVTNLATGISPSALSHEEVAGAMAASGESLFQLFVRALEIVSEAG